MYMDCCIEHHIQDLHIRREEYSMLFGSFNHYRKFLTELPIEGRMIGRDSFMRSANFMKHFLPGKRLFIRGDKL